MSLFSIIIPVYKAEKYLHKCIDSVLSQDLEDFELILVNDGSPDSSPDICNAYAAKDVRITVIHKENGGSSSARNTGIEKANGEYLLFLDSDDYWEGSDNLTLLKECIDFRKSDVILYGAKDINPITGTASISRGNYCKEDLLASKEKAIESLIKTAQFPGSAWVMAVRRDLILKNGIYFIINIKAEDIDWIIHLFTKAETFDSLNKPFYMYIKDRPGSITNTADVKSAKDILFSVSKWHKTLCDNSNKTNRYLLAFLSYQYLTSFIVFAKLPVTLQNELRPFIEKEKSIVRFLYGIRGNIAKYLLVIFGVKNAAALFMSFHKFNHRFPFLKRRLV